MNQKQIKNRKDLPEAFSLEKYRPTYDFDINDWINNLQARYMLTVERPYADVKIPSDYILSDPIFKGNKVNQHAGFTKNLSDDASNIRNFTATDLFFCDRKYLGDSLKNYIDEADAIESVKDGDLYSSTLLDTPLYKIDNCCGDGNIMIEVNLHGTDEKIMNDFANWLKTTRREVEIVAPKKKKFTRTDFDDWAKNAILPYIDLTTWASKNGVEITQQLMGNSLFPDEIDVNLPERIRKVIAPMARKIIDSIMLDALIIQANAEQAE
ncbi:DUF6387 family protein [Undibacterium arcticum]|uniref:DUF6387 family protein n=1 Tax=Undibacterium arcticum TaxID=1762892 RepID=A0ABV7EYR9_9BURK